MRARLQQDRLGAPQEVEELRTVVIYDDFEQPILVVRKMEQGQILTSKCTDPGFHDVLKALGIELNATCKVAK